jgi:carboxylate-amine ligase
MTMDTDAVAAHVRGPEAGPPNVAATVADAGPAAARRPTGTAMVGAEEELLMVSPRSLRLTPVPAALFERLSPRPYGRTTAELCRESIELVSAVCTGGDDVAEALRALRHDVAAAGGTLLASGVHPAAGYLERTITDTPRYTGIAASLEGLIRTPTCALQVHVGMPDEEAMIRAYNHLRAEMPLLLALSANSPFWHGTDSGLASSRTAIIRAYPRGGTPPVLRDFADFLALEARLTAIAEVPDYTYFWWDVRPHPRLGTVEVRVMDVQSSLDDTAALISLVQGLATAAVTGDAIDPPPESIEECQFRAARYGIRARLADAAGCLRPVTELAADAVRRARAHLGDDRPLAGIERILATGGGAGRQRAAFRRRGMTGLLRMLAAETGA